MCSCAGGGVDSASVGPWFAGVCGEDRVGDDQLLFLSGVGVARALRAAAAICLRKPAYLVAPMAPARSAGLEQRGRPQGAWLERVCPHAVLLQVIWHRMILE